MKETTPGYTLHTENFSIEFMSANEQDKTSYRLEFETDWKEVMQVLLAVLEVEPRDCKKAEQLASIKLEEWAMQQQGGEDLNLKISAVFQEKKYYKVDYFKTLKLIFNDSKQITVFFHVNKKCRKRSLKELAAEAVSYLCSKLEDIEALEIPKTLHEDVKAAFNDSWRPRHVNTTPKKKKIKLQQSINQLDCPMLLDHEVQEVLADLNLEDIDFDFEFNYDPEDCELSFDMQEA